MALPRHHPHTFLRGTSLLLIQLCREGTQLLAGLERIYLIVPPVRRSYKAYLGLFKPIQYVL
jgi:hypothetical protein